MRNRHPASILGGNPRHALGIAQSKSSPAEFRSSYMEMRHRFIKRSVRRYGQRLQIASEIARAHCGMLTAGSLAEKTRFAFRMPLQEPAAFTTTGRGPE